MPLQLRLIYDNFRLVLGRDRFVETDLWQYFRHFKLKTTFDFFNSSIFKDESAGSLYNFLNRFH